MNKIFLIAIIFLPLLAKAQNYPYNNEAAQELEQLIGTKYCDKIHTAIKPYNRNQLIKYFNPDSCFYRKKEIKIFGKELKRNWFIRKMFYENFINLEKGEFVMQINPLFNLELGKDDSGILKGSIPLSVNRRGLEVKGQIGKNFEFYSSFAENQAFYPEYINNYIVKHLIVPGQGMPKIFQDKGHDFAYAGAYINYTFPFEKIDFDLRLGHGSNFFGDGYRSLILSDNSSYYPFLRLSLKYKKWRYVSMFTAFEDFEIAYYNYHYRRHGTFNFLSYIPTNWLQLVFFESIIWKTSNHKNYKNRFPLNFFNPVIFSRTINYGLNDEHNMILGTNISLIPFAGINFYGQFVVDDFHKNKTEKKRYYRNKYGYQLGLKINGITNLALLKKLYLQAEYNKVMPYTYGHENIHQNYSHLNQPLAHPLGGGFKEYLGIIRYQSAYFSFEAKLTEAVVSEDKENEHWGTDIFKSENKASKINEPYNSKVGQGTEATITNKYIRIALRLNPKTNMQIFTEIRKREYKSSTTKQNTNYISFGFRTMLKNNYFDF